MSEELSKKIVEWLDGLKNLATEEIPPFVHEVARYGFISNIFEAIFIFVAQIIVFSLSMFCIYKLRFTEFEKYSDVKLLYGLGAVLPIIAGMIMFFPLCQSIQMAMKAKMTPKLYVIERFL